MDRQTLLKVKEEILKMELRDFNWYTNNLHDAGYIKQEKVLELIEEMLEITS